MNFASYLQGAFSPEAIEKARQKEAILALKILARQHASEDDPIRAQYPKCWYRPITDMEEARLAMTFTLSMPVTAAVPPGDARPFTMALDLVTDIKLITPEQLEKLKVLASTFTPIFEKNA